MRTELLACRENASEPYLNRPDRAVSGAGRRSNKPVARQFRASRQRIVDVEDSLAEGSGFELSVPISKLADDNFPATFATLADDDDRVQKRRVQSIQPHQQQAIDVPRPHECRRLAP
jgi:hypothetical protein